ncbi:hypothetical protein THIOSC13_1490003 [uncultured Thiomicrorhabdus sp.]
MGLMRIIRILVFMFLLFGDNAAINTNGAGINANYDQAQFNELSAR